MIVFGVRVISSPNGSPGFVPGAGLVSVCPGGGAGGAAGAWAKDEPAPASASAVTMKTAGSGLPRQNIGFSCRTSRRTGRVLLQPARGRQPAEFSIPELNP